MAMAEQEEHATTAQIKEEHRNAASAIFHQKQRLQLCLLHALNNLFQGETTFSRSELNRIASELSAATELRGGLLSRMFGLHHNIITGNYDANVLMAALQSRGKQAIWYDRRKGAAALDLSDVEKKLVGIILNHPTTRFAGVWKGRHWAALRKIQGLWYDLDSYLEAPHSFVHGEEEVKQFLEQSFAEGSEAFIVFEGEANAARNTTDTRGIQERSGAA